MQLEELVRQALAEDIGPGDLTTRACVPAHLQGTGRIHAKQELVVAGQRAAAEVFRQMGVDYQVVAPDGAPVQPGEDVGLLNGSLAAILTGERLALNFLMKLSGIATHVRPYVQATEGRLRVVDTRKTTPLLRELEKEAVRAGGAHNHRYALYDGVMLKDNHLIAVGSIGAAIRKVRESTHHLIRIEVEVERLDQIEEAITAGADVLLLDNMDDDTLRRAVDGARGLRPDIILEASGNITPERIARINHIGLDLVSAGGLIHQARWVDLSLSLDE